MDTVVRAQVVKVLEQMDLVVPVQLVKLFQQPDIAKQLFPLSHTHTSDTEYIEQAIRECVNEIKKAKAVDRQVGAVI